MSAEQVTVAEFLAAAAVAGADKGPVPRTRATPPQCAGIGLVGDPGTTTGARVSGGALAGVLGGRGRLGLAAQSGRGSGLQGQVG